MRRRTSDEYNAAMLTASSIRGQVSQMRISTVGKASEGRMSHHSSLALSMNLMR